MSATRTVFVAAKVPTAVFTTSPDASTTNPTNAPTNVSADPAAEAVDVDYYSWTLRSYPDGISQTSSSSEAPTFANLPAGNYFLGLTVKGLDDPTPVYTEKRLRINGKPSAPGPPTKVGQGCCDTWGTFRFAAVPGADQYEVLMQGYFLGGCVSDHSDITGFTTPASGGTYTATVQAAGLCLGSNYDVRVRARVYGGPWSDWSSSRRIRL